MLSTKRKKDLIFYNPVRSSRKIIATKLFFKNIMNCSLGIMRDFQDFKRCILIKVYLKNIFTLILFLSCFSELLVYQQQFALCSVFVKTDRECKLI